MTCKTCIYCVYKKSRYYCGGCALRDINADACPRYKRAAVDAQLDPRFSFPRRAFPG